MMGYGNELSPTLGAPWVKTARHLLAGEVEHEKGDDDHGANSLMRANKKKGKKEKKPGDGLPEPTEPPNGTHSQL
jgi:acid phosphatase